MLGFPWYDGPSGQTYQRYNEVFHYFGRLQERCYALNWLGEKHGLESQQKYLEEVDKLDRLYDDGAEYTLNENTVFEFGQCNQGDLSLPGLARERLVESAQMWGADWLLMWDADMWFNWSFFLRLWRHQKPVVAALAFTAREPPLPVIYRVKEMYEEKGIVYKSEQVLDYPKDKLISSEDIGGSIGFGSGVVLINMNVFKQIQKPWFYSTGCGEDWMFCIRCHQNGIPRYVDTATKTHHPRRKPVWINEEYYEEFRNKHPDQYEMFLKDISDA